MKRSTTPQNKFIKILLSAVFWTAVWQLVAVLIGKEVLVPTPLSTLRALYMSACEADFWAVVVRSMLRVFGGFAAGCIFGAALAVLTERFAVCDVIFSPAIRMIRAIPVASFIILVLLWLNSNILPAFISMLMVLPVVWGNVTAGIQSADEELLEVGEIFGFSRLKKLKLIYIPTVRPYFVSSAVTSLGMAWKAGVAAEVICRPKAAIGTNLYYAKIYLETQDLFAWTIVVIVLSLLLEKAVKKLLGHFLGGE